MPPASELQVPLVPLRSHWAQVGTLFGCFGGAAVAGLWLGHILQPDGDATAAVIIFALLSVFVGGLALWGTIAASIMAKTIFNGHILPALLRFFLRGRRREDLPRLELDRTKIQAAALRVLGWTRVFVWLAIAIALIAAPLAGWLASRSFVVAMPITAAVIVAYGVILRSLARAGYLIPPDVE